MKFKLFFLLIFIVNFLYADKILIPMDTSQKNHLKAYGIVYWCLNKKESVDWLLNYKGGSFIVSLSEDTIKECKIRNVSFKKLSNEDVNSIFLNIEKPDKNQAIVTLESNPEIAVYSPKSKLPWDDAVTLALTYAEIPYTIIYDEEILNEALTLYDWLHLHHEDFTGQYGRFYATVRSVPWYIQRKINAEKLATKLGYSKVSDQKKAVVLKIKEYVINGGFMFAMCSATDSFDIALSAENIDICEAMFDDDPSTPNYQSKLNFSNAFAFSNFILERDPFIYEFSNIDMTNKRNIPKDLDYFSLTEYSAKWDPVPTMLCQNHTTIIKGFMGQTTSYNPETIKSTVLILGKNTINDEGRYIHGVKGKGFFTFYGGHDPEDYQHLIGDPKTELDLHPNSPGYRLILNNVLFPAARKKHPKT